MGYRSKLYFDVFVGVRRLTEVVEELKIVEVVEMLKMTEIVDGYGRSHKGIENDWNCRGVDNDCHSGTQYNI